MPTLYEQSFRSVSEASETSSSEDSQGYIQITPGNLFASGFPFIVTTWQVSLKEKTHILESFNEHVHAYAFGKGVGTAQIGGHSLEHETINPKHEQIQSRLLKEYADNLRALKAAENGQLVRISGPGSVTFSGIVTALSMSLSANPSNVLNFQLQLLILDSVLGI